jgi:hypothetical protein
MAGNLLDYDEVRYSLVMIRSDLDTLGQQLHDAKHHHEGAASENVAAAADEVMQAWAKVCVALVNLDTIQPATRPVTTVRVTGGVL